MVPSTKHVLTPYHLLPFISPLQVHELEAMLRAGACMVTLPCCEYKCSKYTCRSAYMDVGLQLVSQGCNMVVTWL